MSREYVFGSAQSGTGSLTVAGATSLNMLGCLAAGNAAEYLRHWIGQSANATSAQQRVQFVTQVAVFPTNAVSATPKPLKSTDPASKWSGGTTIAAGVTGVNIGTEGAGTKTLQWEDTFNVLNGYLLVNTPADTFVLSSNGTATSFNMWFPTAPATLTAWSWGQMFREI